jgi:hypothetical protein
MFITFLKKTLFKIYKVNKIKKKAPYLKNTRLLKFGFRINFKIFLSEKRKN